MVFHQFIRPIICQQKQEEQYQVKTQQGHTTNFFEQVDQMGIPNATVVQLQAEAIEGLVDFNKDSLQQLTDNLHCPGGRIPDQIQQMLPEQQF